MCGIFAVVAEQPSDLTDAVLGGLRTLEYRGYDSWGVACLTPTQVPNQDRILVRKKAGRIGDAQITDMGKTQAAIGHTRWATHGGVTDLNAHPHLDCQGQVAVVHNGIVENMAALKQQLSSHTFSSETDTEVIAHLFEKYRERNDLFNSLKATFAELKGLNSVAFLDAATGSVIGIKQGSPLLYAEGNGVQYLVSDSVALPRTSERVHYLEDGEAVSMRPEGATLIKLETGKEVPWRFEPLAANEGLATKGAFPNFLLKEISEQPAVVEKVIKQALELQQLFQSLDPVVRFVGCGTAYHACFFASYLLSQADPEKVVISVPGSEFGHFVNTVSKNQSTVFISQSGETIDLIENALLLGKRHLPVTSLVNRPGSTLARLSTRKVITPAGVELSVLATKSFVAQLATILLLAHSKNQATAIADLATAASVIKKMVTSEYQENSILPVAQKLCDSEHVFTLGRGQYVPIALETALKIKEVTYKHVEGLAGGELKHGVLALVEAGTPVIAHLPPGSEKNELLSNVMEIKARGGYIIGISETAESVFDSHIPIRNAGLATPLVQAVAGQLLAYHMALLLGRDVDKPRNLAKSVTVK